MKRIHFIIILLVWSIVILSSLVWNIYTIRNNTLQLVENKSQAFFDEIETTRLWNARHGGVYVPITEETQPNPYLKVPNRDVTTETGQKLTKVNPAFMTRQIANIAKINNDINYHLTSLNPIRPANKADEWEAIALHEFETGSAKKLNKLTTDSIEVYRFMAPLIVKEGCMKCHAAQGYKVGDIRGGISVTMPSEIYQKSQNSQERNIYIMHFIVLFVGVAGITKYNIVSNNHLNVLNRMNEELLQQKEELFATNEELKATTEAVEMQNAEINNQNEELHTINETLKDTNNALAKSEAQFKAINDLAPIGLLVFDDEGKNIYVNNAYERISGLSIDECRADGWQKAIHPEEHFGVLYELTDWHKSELTQHSKQLKYKNSKNGKTVIVNTKSAKLIINQVFSGSITVVEDITEQKKIQMELSKSESNLKALFDSTQQVIFLLNKKGEIIKFNKLAKAYIAEHFDQELTEGDDFIKYSTRKNKEVVREYIEKALKDVASIFEREIQFLSSEKRWFKIQYLPVHDKDYKTYGTLLSLTDITLTKHAELAIKRSEEILNRVFNNMNASIYVSDLQTSELLFVNEKFVKIFGKSVGKCWDVIHNRTEKCSFCKSNEPDSENYTKGINTWEFQSPDNKKWFYVSGSVLEWTDQKMVQLAIATDITDRKMLEETLIQSKKELEEKNNIINIRNQNITASINYASRIQKAILPTSDLFTNSFREHFILFKPRDVVSGDFYWAQKIDKYLIFVGADCTGHGVPGAFVSMLGISILNEVIQSKLIWQSDQKASQILEQLRSRVKTAFHYEGGIAERKDGMDMALCVIDTETNKLQYAGANIPLCIIRKTSLPAIDIEYVKTETKNDFIITQIKADAMPIGIFRREQPFVNHEIQLENNDYIYLFSDGFLDQLGGENGKKFMIRNFRKLLLDIHSKPMKEQNQMLKKTLKEWQNSHEQVDDILVMGMKV